MQAVTVPTIMEIRQVVMSSGFMVLWLVIVLGTGRHALP